MCQRMQLKLKCAVETAHVTYTNLLQFFWYDALSVHFQWDDVYTTWLQLHVGNHGVAILFKEARVTRVEKKLR